MDLEIHDLPQGVRPTLSARLRNYRTELQRLKKELVCCNDDDVMMML